MSQPPPPPSGRSPDTDPPRPSLLEWPVPRLLLEGLLGGAGGALLAWAVHGSEGAFGLFAGVGAVAAPLSLLLTPRTGGVAYRAFRYGLALSVLVTLIASFVAGAESFPLEELLAFGMVLLILGWIGHGAMAYTVDRAFPPSSVPGELPPT